MSYSQEEWKPVVGYESVYEVSSLGRVRRIGRAYGATPGYILKHHLNHSGYPTVKLRNKGHDQTKLVHLLVAEAFLGPRPPLHETNHKDKGTTDPSLSNLEYATSQDNKIHAARNGSLHYRLTPESVREIRSRYYAGTSTCPGNAKSLAAEFGITAQYLGKVVHRHYWANID